MCFFTFALSSYHQKDKRLPIFKFLQPQSETSQKEKEKETVETLNVLVNSEIEKKLVCSIPPRRVKNGKSFIIDTSLLKDPNDILADDTGSWIHNGHRKKYFFKHYDGHFIQCSANEAASEEEYFILNCGYYINKSEKDFRRKISFVKGN